MHTISKFHTNRTMDMKVIQVLVFHTHGLRCQRCPSHDASLKYFAVGNYKGFFLNSHTQFCFNSKLVSHMSLKVNTILNVVSFFIPILSVKQYRSISILAL